MASLIENYNERRATGTPIPSRILDVFDTTQGLTDEIYAKNVKSTFGNDAPAWVESGEVSDEPAIPTLDVVFQKLGIKDTKDKKAYEHFVEDFPKKYNDYKSKLQKDPNWGEKGWKTVLDLWKQSIPQYEQEKARKEREKDTNIFQKLLLPRSTERYISGQPIQWKDALLDIGENAAMAVPGSGWVGALGKLPRVGGAVASAASRFPRASRVIGNTVVPVVSEGADDIAYDPGEGMDDRADFSVGDAALGTLVNNAADAVAFRRFSQPTRLLTDVSDNVSGEIKDVISQLGTTSKQRRKAMADANREEIKKTASAVISGGTPTSSELKSIVTGSSDNASSTTRGAVKSAKEAEKVLGFIDEGKLNPKDKRGIEIAERGGKIQAARQSFRKLLKLNDDLKETTDPEIRKLIEEQIYDETLVGKNLPPKIKPSDIMDVSSLTKSEKAMVDRAFQNNPKLYSNLFADSKVQSDFLKPESWYKAGWGNLKDAASYSGIPFVENKLGKSEWLGSQANELVNVANKEHEESRQKGRNVAFSDVLKAAPVNSDDAMFIDAVRKNPDVLTYGLNSGDPATDERFKIWLLSGGHKKISGLPGVRPLWEVR